MKGGYPPLCPLKTEVFNRQIHPRTRRGMRVLRLANTVSRAPFPRYVTYGATTACRLCHARPKERADLFSLKGDSKPCLRRLYSLTRKQPRRKGGPQAARSLPFPSPGPPALPVRCPARPSGGRHRPPLFAARSEYAERSDAREGECGRPGRPRRPSRLPGEGGPHGRPPGRP